MGWNFTNASIPFVCSGRPSPRRHPKGLFVGAIEGWAYYTSRTYVAYVFDDTYFWCLEKDGGNSNGVVCS
ncbi:hypothetical protein EYC80_007809 [Monilinia laxa]|uniref:Uncharacterized protein n=1 Tax=Monilinia laxa TaxID=61186 RepID=A0A5N6JX12_MONLA|nr:hypothetical protein EYC80_007809 [Monilinia laxa]